ncbi:MAG: LacI family transcriptional regulator [Candidatus Hydrogenedentes bacterium]|nr:LacI family transcriptional regulator [Candidatus Hydrogenedentota bacterium]
MKRKVTIYDIAKEAGVSPKTVSKVINNKDGVKFETRVKILEIIKKTGYHPNIFARSLRVNTPACIGITFPAPIEIVPFSSKFFLWLFYELYRIFGKKGEYICFDFMPYETFEIRNYARGVFDNLFRACVLVGPIALNDTTVRKIHDAGIPYVAFGRLSSFPEISHATVDYEYSAYISTKFLIERGHKVIGFLQAFDGYQPGAERIAGYRRALEEFGIPFNKDLVQPVKFNFDSLYRSACYLLSNPSITAIVDGSGNEDPIALREASRLAGKEFGKDVEIVIWTYEERRMILREAIAHVWLPVRESATHGLEELSKWIAEERSEPIRVLYPPRLDTARTRIEVEIPPEDRLFYRES